MKHINKRTLILLAVCAVLLVWSAAQVSAVGNDLQYLVPAPALETESDQQADTQTGETVPATQTKPNAQTLALVTSLQTAAEAWDGVIQFSTLSGILEDASFTSDAKVTLQARLNALGPDAFLLTPKYLLSGRLFYPEELKIGSHGILLDEQLALALFRIAEPIGRTVTFSDIDFTVVGVLRHSKRVGDSGEYEAYIPLAALWDEAVQLDALQVTAQPVPGAGARATFKTDMENWQSGGTLIDLGKEGMGALLPLRVLLFFCGSVVFFRLLRYWNGRFRRFYGDYRQRLALEYAAKLMPRLAAGTLVLALGYALLTLGAAVLIRYIVAPVYTFPEWVPAVLVEWDDIQTTFWQVWQGAASLRELRSPELIRIRYFAMLTAWFSAGAAVALTSLWTRLRFNRRELPPEDKA